MSEGTTTLLAWAVLREYSVGICVILLTPGNRCLVGQW